MSDATPRSWGCRECSECQGASHHWLGDPHCPDDMDDDERTLVGDYGCKHCDARGDECPDCEGVGAFGDLGEGEYELCLTCNGEGVVFVGLGSERMAPTP